jgi:hypothetical protein
MKKNKITPKTPTGKIVDGRELLAWFHGLTLALGYMKNCEGVRARDEINSVQKAIASYARQTRAYLGGELNREIARRTKF